MAKLISVCHGLWAVARHLASAVSERAEAVVHWYEALAMALVAAAIAVGLVVSNPPWPAAQRRRVCRARIDRLVERIHDEHAEWYR